MITNTLKLNSLTIRLSTAKRGTGSSHQEWVNCGSPSSFWTFHYNELTTAPLKPTQTAIPVQP